MSWPRWFLDSLLIFLLVSRRSMSTIEITVPITFSKLELKGKKHIILENGNERC